MDTLLRILRDKFNINADEVWVNPDDYAKMTEVDHEERQPQQRCIIEPEPPKNRKQRRAAERSKRK